MANRWGKNGNSDRLYFLGLQNSVNSDCSHEIKKCLLLGRKAMTNLDSMLKSRDITLPTKVHIVKAMVLSSSHVWMWELDHKKGWVLKNWCFQTMVLKKSLESPLDSMEIKPVNSKGNPPLIFIWRIKAEAPIFWSFDENSRLIRKDPDAGKYWGQEKKGVIGDGVVGWHHQLNGHEFEQALWDSEGQGSLACCSPWGCKELDRTEQQQQQNYPQIAYQLWGSKLHSREPEQLVRVIKINMTTETDGHLVAPWDILGRRHPSSMQCYGW